MKRYYIKRARRALGRSWRALIDKPLIEPWFDVRSALTLTLGRTLIVWSERATGHPPDMDFDQWKDTLRKHGESLIEFERADEEDVLSYDHNEVRKAQEALRWTADNLLGLWD